MPYLAMLKNPSYKFFDSDPDAVLYSLVSSLVYNFTCPPLALASGLTVLPFMTDSFIHPYG